jgi:AraC family transcriptional regulator, carnitine catabolism transcriptional activator
MDSHTEIFWELALLGRVRPELQQICRFGMQWTLTSRRRHYLADLRPNLARHRIRATTMSAAAVGESVGYQSESAFSRAYRRRFAVTPSEDRKDAIGVRG